MSIKIYTDTSSDMPEEIREKYDIGMFRFLSVFDGKSYVTGKDIDNKQFYEMLKNSDKIPTTSQTPVADMYDELLAASKEYDTVIYITISSKGSGQYGTACMLREQILDGDNPNADIRIVDSMKYSLYLTSAAIKAAQMAQEGASADDIVAECEKEFASWDVVLLVDSLEYLEKGGRINKAAAVIGSLLDIKPVLTIRDGIIDSVAKMRGKKKLMSKLIDMALEDERYDSDKNEVMIVHSDNDKLNEMLEILKDEHDIQPVMVSEFGPIVGTHTGPGTIALIYKIK